MLVNEVPRLEEHRLRKRFDRRKTVAPVVVGRESMNVLIRRLSAPTR